MGQTPSALTGSDSGGSAVSRRVAGPFVVGGGICTGHTPAQGEHTSPAVVGDRTAAVRSTSLAEVGPVSGAVERLATAAKRTDTRGFFGTPLDEIDVGARARENSKRGCACGGPVGEELKRFGWRDRIRGMIRDGDVCPDGCGTYVPQGRQPTLRG